MNGTILQKTMLVIAEVLTQVMMKPLTGMFRCSISHDNLFVR